MFLTSVKLNLNQIKLNQTKTDCFVYRNPLLKGTEPENGKLHSYWNHSNIFLPPKTYDDGRETIAASVHKQNWNNCETKMKLTSFILFPLTKFQKFWVPEYLLYQCTLIIKYNQREVPLLSLQSFLSQRNHTWSLFGNQ